MTESIRQESQNQHEIAQDYFSAGEIEAGEIAQATAERIDLAIDVANRHTIRDVSKVAANDLGPRIAGLYEVQPQRSSIDKNFLLNSTSHMAIAHVLVHEEAHHESRIKGDSTSISSVAIEEGLNEISTGQRLGHAPMTYEREQTLVHQIASQTQTSVQTLVQNFRNGKNTEINQVIQTAANNNNTIAQQLAA